MIGAVSEGVAWTGVSAAWSVAAARVSAVVARVVMVAAAVFMAERVGGFTGWCFWCFFVRRSCGLGGVRSGGWWRRVGCRVGQRGW